MKNVAHQRWRLQFPMWVELRVFPVGLPCPSLSSFPSVYQGLGLAASAQSSRHYLPVFSSNSPGSSRLWSPSLFLTPKHFPILSVSLSGHLKIIFNIKIWFIFLAFPWLRYGGQLLIWTGSAILNKWQPSHPTSKLFFHLHTKCLKHLSWWSVSNYAHTFYRRKLKKKCLLPSKNLAQSKLKGTTAELGRTKYQVKNAINKD